jgi:hypothetical protein
MRSFLRARQTMKTDAAKSTAVTPPISSVCEGGNICLKGESKLPLEAKTP